MFPARSREIVKELTDSKMREELKNNYSFDHTNKLFISEVEDVYPKCSLYRYLEELAESAEFLKYSTLVIRSRKK